MRSSARCKQHAFALLWIALSSAVRPPPPPELSLEGACAGVKSSESWKDPNTGSHWSYRIKVQPWTVFGRVHVDLHGYNVKVVDIYSGDVDVKAKSFWVTLHPEHLAGPDHTFQIEGEGETYAEPTLTCEGLHEVVRSRYALSSRTRTHHPCFTTPPSHRTAVPCTQHLACACVPTRCPSGHELPLAGLAVSLHLILSDRAVSFSQPMVTSAEACPLAPQFVLQSDMDELQNGRFRAYVHVQTWYAPPAGCNACDAAASACTALRVSQGATDHRHPRLRRVRHHIGR